jgi:HAD superfamily hydrolase (TIGR01458 family)
MPRPAAAHRDDSVLGARNYAPSRPGLPGQICDRAAMPGEVSSVLIDLDGVLYVEQEPIDGAVDAVKRLRDRGIGLRFVTNTTAHSRDRTLAKLDRLGFSVAEHELVTPAALALRYCRQRGHRRAALVMNEEVKRDFAELEEAGEGAQAVIVGDLGSAFGYDVLNHAFRCVMEGAELIALQKNRYWLRADGLSLDVGPFVAAIEYATSSEAYVVGKPARGFFEQILEDLRVDAAAATMVGDDIESDIGGALHAGLQAILVRTGKYREERVAESGIRPTAVVDSIADVPELLGC